MDSVTPPPASPVVRVKLDVAVTQLRGAASSAALNGDPMAGAFEALATSIAALGDLRESAKADQKFLEETLEDRATSVAEEAIANLQPALEQQLNRLAQQRLFTWRLKWIMGSVSAGIIALAVAGGYVYSVAYAAGRTQGELAGQTINAAMAAGPGAASAWALLMKNNDPVRALAACRKSAATDADGRQYCSMPVWLSPPAAPGKNGS